MIIRGMGILLLYIIIICSLISIPLFDLRIHRIEDRLGLDRSLTPPWFIWVEDHNKEVTKKDEPKK